MNKVNFDALVSKYMRARMKSQTPLCIWLTGLSGAGKTTIAMALERKLFDMGRHTFLLDGDSLRCGLNMDLGFSLPDRSENVRRVSEVSKLMVDAGLIVIVSAISPIAFERSIARDRFLNNEFVEVFVDTPLALCEQRDVKGLYKRARRGEISDFTGIDSPYERPISPEVHVFTEKQSVDECVADIVGYIS